MKTRANTTVTILRGTTVDTFGDTVDTATEVASGITASIIETGKTATTAVDGQPRQIRRITGRLPAGTDIRTGDRVRSRAGRVYVVDAIDQIENAVRTNDIRLDLRRVT